MNAHPRPNDAWLALHREPVVDPGIEIVDPHHHFVDEGPGRYSVAETLRDFACGHRVVASVHMQCQTRYRMEGPEALKPVGETEYVRDLTSGTFEGSHGPISLAAGIVGSMDLMLGDGVAETLEAHVAEGRGRFKGIRPTVIWHGDTRIRPVGNTPSILETPAARRAIARLSPLGLSLDLWAFFTQLAEVSRICRTFPDTRMIVDHCGGPIGIGDYADGHEEMFRCWRAAVERLAAYPNAAIKFGGLGMRYAGFAFERLAAPPSSQRLAAAWRPYFDVCLNAFGPDRLMFESNFPIDRGMFDYGILWNAFKRLTAACSADERAEMFSGTARRIYGIAPAERSKPA